MTMCVCVEVIMWQRIWLSVYLVEECEVRDV